MGQRFFESRRANERHAVGHRHGCRGKAYIIWGFGGHDWNSLRQRTRVRTISAVTI